MNLTSRDGIDVYVRTLECLAWEAGILEGTEATIEKHQRSCMAEWIAEGEADGVRRVLFSPPDGYPPSYQWTVRLCSSWVTPDSWDAYSLLDVRWYTHAWNEDLVPMLSEYVSRIDWKSTANDWTD